MYRKEEWRDGKNGGTEGEREAGMGAREGGRDYLSYLCIPDRGEQRIIYFLEKKKDTCCHKLSLLKRTIQNSRDSIQAADPKNNSATTLGGPVTVENYESAFQ